MFANRHLYHVFDTHNFYQILCLQGHIVTLAYFKTISYSFPTLIIHQYYLFQGLTASQFHLCNHQIYSPHTQHSCCLRPSSFYYIRYWLHIPDSHIPQLIVVNPSHDGFLQFLKFWVSALSSVTQSNVFWIINTYINSYFPTSLLLLGCITEFYQEVAHYKHKTGNS